MTDQEVLLDYRLNQADETLADAEQMLQLDMSPRSIVNRAYYAAFYTVLALFIRTNMRVQTSRHSGVIAIFDKEFVHTGKIEKTFSRILHDLFDARQEFDYKELVNPTVEEAAERVRMAKDFVNRLKSIVAEMSFSS
jgi:uncharacterized protein (UPF0332 family)